MSDAQPVVQNVEYQASGGPALAAGAEAVSAGPVAPVAGVPPSIGPLVAFQGAVSSEAAAAPSVAIGDWVEYRLAAGNGFGCWRPALVVRVLEGLLNLLVFTDGANDYLVCPLWCDAVPFGAAVGAWRARQGKES